MNIMISVLLFGSSVLMAGSTRVAPRLESLSPLNPVGYLIQGEALFEAEETRVLGEQVLAVGVLTSAERDPQLAASMAIALASISKDPLQHNGLWMMAIRLDPMRAAEYRWIASQSAPSLTGSMTAQVLAQLRTNDPDGVRGINQEHRDRIVAEAKRLGLDHNRAATVLKKWERDAESDPCRGRLFVRKREGDRIVTDACPLPAFHHNDDLDADWTLMVAIELSLAQAQPESWEARIGLGIDQPVQVWSLARLAKTFDVSADRPVLRGGRWVVR